MYELTYSKQALKALRKMPRPTALNIRSKIEELTIDPAKASNVKKLKGSQTYRLRVGDWRVVYVIDQGIVTITVLKIASRGEVYK